jgi:hypothetical protein
MKTILKLSTLFIVFSTLLLIVACNKEKYNYTELQNPFIGTWRANFSDGSREEFTFNADKTFQQFFYYADDGSSDVLKGNYDFSERINTLTIVVKEQGEPDDIFTFIYQFVNSTTLRLIDIDDDERNRMYFKQ